MNRYNFMGHEYYRMPVIYHLGYHEWMRDSNDKSGKIPEEMRTVMNMHAEDIGANTWKASEYLSTSDYWFVEFLYDPRMGDLDEDVAA